MRFFEHQDQARRNTRRLILLMAVGVLAMGVSIYAVLVFALRMWGAYPVDPGAPLVEPLRLGLTVAGTGAVVALASGARVLSLRGGGGQVAEMLGGRLVSNRPQDETDKRLLNVVEEMAIASGIPAPLVYVLDEETGINAFAAGYTLDDAAIAVTRGALNALSRDELQGVIAHEFSHVLNGDMRMNLRIMGVVFGIICVGLLGRLLLRVGAGGRHGRRRKNDAAGMLLMVGLGLLLVGLLGELFGRLIKAAVGRQREFLADASAVQFTRNPRGIVGALTKIRDSAEGSRIASSRAEEASHFFFNDIHRQLFGGGGWFATHPPLAERLRRLDPSGSEADAAPPPTRAAAAQPQPSARAAAAQPQPPARAAAAQAQPPSARISPQTSQQLHAAAAATASVIAQVGMLSDRAMAAGERLRMALPDALVEAAHRPYEARALVYALLLSDDPTLHERQRAQLTQLESAVSYRDSARLQAMLQPLSRRARLSLVSLCTPALRELSPQQRGAFGVCVRALINADQKLSVFEYVVAETLRKWLLQAQPPHARARVRYHTLAALQQELAVLLSLLAHTGHPQPGTAERTFEAACQSLGNPSLTFLPASQRLLTALGPALEKLEQLTPALKRTAFEACVRAVLFDRQVSDDELTLLSAVGEALGCPLPAVLGDDLPGPQDA